jgi:hypothetical protein
VSKNPIIIVHLRRPNNRSDPRSDPFWEFGNFGVTGCHGNNLMAIRNADKLKGVRLAFAQGGKEGTRLVYLTPKVRIEEHPRFLEAKWSTREMPFRYCDAPILVSNNVDSDFPRLEKSIIGRRETIEGQFSSCFRSRTTPVPEEIAEELDRVYTQKREQAETSKSPAIACSYEQALPLLPLKFDRDRRARSRTYKQKLKEARRSKPRDGCAGPSRTGSPPRGAGRPRPC